MKNKDKIILTKILKYIEEQYEFINGYTYEEFQKDNKTVMYMYLI